MKIVALLLMLFSSTIFADTLFPSGYTMGVPYVVDRELDFEGGIRFFSESNELILSLPLEEDSTWVHRFSDIIKAAYVKIGPYEIQLVEGFQLPNPGGMIEDNEGTFSSPLAHDDSRLVYVTDMEACWLPPTKTNDGRLHVLPEGKKYTFDELLKECKDNFSAYAKTDQFEEDLPYEILFAGDVNCPGSRDYGYVMGDDGYLHYQSVGCLDTKSWFRVYKVTYQDGVEVSRVPRYVYFNLASIRFNSRIEYNLNDNEGFTDSPFTQWQDSDIYCQVWDVRDLGGGHWKKKCAHSTSAYIGGILAIKEVLLREAPDERKQFVSFINGFFPRENDPDWEKEERERFASVRPYLRFVDGDQRIVHAIVRNFPSNGADYPFIKIQHLVPMNGRVFVREVNFSLLTGRFAGVNEFFVGDQETPTEEIIEYFNGSTTKADLRSAAVVADDQSEASSGDGIGDGDGGSNPCEPGQVLSGSGVCVHPGGGDGSTSRCRTAVNANTGGSGITDYARRGEAGEAADCIIEALTAADIDDIERPEVDIELLDDERKRIIEELPDPDVNLSELRPVLGGEISLMSLSPGDFVECRPLVFSADVSRFRWSAEADFDMCGFFSVVRSVLAWFFGVVTMIYVWRTFTESQE